MKAHSESFQVSTRGKGTYEITDEVTRIVRASGVKTGTATVFVQHTSASLVIYENADPSARTDLHAFFERLVPEDQDYFVHTAEGPDDMPSHLRMDEVPRREAAEPRFREEGAQGQGSEAGRNALRAIWSRSAQPSPWPPAQA